MRGQHDRSEVDQLRDDQTGHQQPCRRPGWQPAPARDGPGQDQRGQPGDTRFPGEVAGPAVVQAGAQQVSGTARAGTLREIGQLAVDGDLGQGEPRPYRPGEAHDRRQVLAEQVDFAGTRQAQPGRGGTDFDHLAGYRHRLHGGNQERDADGHRRDQNQASRAGQQPGQPARQPPHHARIRRWASAATGLPRPAPPAAGFPQNIAIDVGTCTRCGRDACRAPPHCRRRPVDRLPRGGSGPAPGRERTSGVTDNRHGDQQPA